MNARAAQDPPTESSGFEDDLAPRPRPRYLTPLTALLIALILGGVGFYVGIRVEKPDATGGGSSGSARLAATAGTGKASGTGKAAGKGKASAAGARAFASGSGSELAGAAGATEGKVERVKGDIVYVKETDGRTVKVKLTSATTITKSESTSPGKVYPGDSVVVSGSQSANGTVAATSVTDSGASTTSTTTSASSAA